MLPSMSVVHAPSGSTVPARRGRSVTTLALAGLIAGLAGCGSDDGGTGGESSDLAFCVEETNRLRATVGRPAVTRSSALEAYAATGAQQDTDNMEAHGHFGDTNGGGIAFAENTCPAWLGWNVQGTVRDTVAACLEAFWSEGPGGGHYDNMVGNHGALGCGIYLTPSGGITIMQDFGR